MSQSATYRAHPHSALLEPWQEILQTRGADPAVLSASGATLRTFAAIEDEAQELSRRWAQLAPDTRVAVQIGNSPSWPAVFLALLRSSLVTIPLGTDAAPPSFAQFLIDATLAPRALPPSSAALPPLSRETALLKLTSGTTGAPRAVRFTAAQLAADCVNICATMRIAPDDVNYGAIPFAHSYGFSNLITPLLMYGVGLVATEDRLPRAIAEGIRRTGATVFPGTPVLFQHLAAINDAEGIGKLRLGISAGAPLTRPVWTAFRDRFGLSLHTFYGSSECGGIAYDRAGELGEDGFVGQPMDKVSIDVAAEDGRIAIRSEAVGDGYFPEEDPAVLGGRVFHPADLVRQTSAGLVLVGRTSDFINVAGRKLNPFEVEQRLAEFPGVRHVIVFGVESPLRGEEPVACVVGEVDAHALLRHGASVLAAWQVPRDVWIVPELPVSERGKVSRRALAERYAATRAKDEAQL